MKENFAGVHLAIWLSPLYYYMSTHPWHTGHSKVSDLKLYEDFAALEHCSYHASAGSIHLVKFVQSSSAKWQKVTPKNIDDTYSHWIPIKEPQPDIADVSAAPNAWSRGCGEA